MLPCAVLLAGLCAAASPAPAPQPSRTAAAADDDQALEHAFDPPGAPAAPSGPGNLGADVPPPRVAEQAVETEEERAERELASRLEAASTDAELAPLLKEAARLGPLMVLQVQEQWARAAANAHSPARAARAKAWLLACGPGTLKEAMRCRDRALDSMREVGGPSKAEAAKLEEADHCVASSSGGGEHACLGKAIATYKRSRDKLMLARATLAGLDPDETAKRRAALKLCPEPRCATFRAGVLEQLSADQLQASDGTAEQAVRDALEAIKLRQSAMPAAQRLYARTEALDRACAPYERTAGRGKCRALERQVLGGYVFHDFSRKSGNTLPQDEAREATDHYTPLLLPCLQEYGEKSGSGRYKLSWTILNDGHVTNVDAVNVDPKGRLMGCLKAQFARWRYPKYRGEWQHVEQEFRVSGTTR